VGGDVQNTDRDRKVEHRRKREAVKGPHDWAKGELEHE